MKTNKRIKLETVIQPYELDAINNIIALTSKGSLEESYEAITSGNPMWLDKAGLQVGRGSNHIWVSNDRGERILLITER